MPGFPLEHLTEDLLDRLVIKNPLYAPAGPPDFTQDQISMMTSTFTDIATAVHYHVLSWYNVLSPGLSDEMVKASGSDQLPGYLSDKVDGVTIKINTGFKAYVHSIPLATADIIGGIKITNNPSSCLFLQDEVLYVRTQENLLNSDSTTEVPTVSAVKQYITSQLQGYGSGDMLKSIYDVDSDGIVDDSEKLGGQIPAYYLDWNNFTNKPDLGGSGLSSAYDRITDGTTTGSASSNDIIKFRANTGLSVTVGSNDPTHGDNVLYSLAFGNISVGTTFDDTDRIILYAPSTGNIAITLANFKNELQTDKFIKGPTSSTNGYLPVWSGTLGNALGAGYPVDTSITVSSTGIPSSTTVKSYVDNAIGNINISIGINNYTTNAILTCPATQGTLDAQPTLTYDATTHTLNHTAGIGGSGAAQYIITGSNSQTSSSKTLVELNNTSSNYLRLVNFSGVSTDSLFSRTMTTNSVLYTNAGDMYIGTTAQKELNFVANNTVIATVYNYGLRITTQPSTYIPPAADDLSIIGDGPSFSISSFHTSNYPIIGLYTSISTTIGTLSATGDGKVLGEISVYSVNNSSAWVSPMKLTFTQDGAAQAYNQAHLTLTTNYSGSSTNKFRWYANGDFKATGTILGNTTITSDIRLKNNFRDIENPLSTLKILKGRWFNYVKQFGDSRSHLGLVAQEVEDILPSLVSDHRILEMGDEVYKTLNYVELIPLLIEAIKELSNQVEMLKGKTI